MRAARAGFTAGLGTAPPAGGRQLAGPPASPPPDLLPLRDPQFCLRECAKHLLLLEDHLLQPRRRCPDCIGKHALTAEAFAEEAQTFAPSAEADAAAGQIRALWSDLRSNRLPWEEAGQRVRTLRKRLYELC